MTASLDAVKAALGRAYATEDAVRASEEHERDLRARAKQGTAEAGALRDARRTEGIQRALAGRAPSDAADPGLKVERRAQADHDAADTLLAERPALLAAAAAARAGVTGATLTFACEWRDAAQEATHAGLRGALADPLAQLIAAELVKMALIGERYGFDAQAHPPASLWSGAFAARALLAALPARLTPPGFAAEVEEAAAALARETLARIGG